MFHKCSTGCWAGTAAAVLPKQGPGNSQKTYYKTFFYKFPPQTVVLYAYPVTPKLAGRQFQFDLPSARALITKLSSGRASTVLSPSNN